MTGQLSPPLGKYKVPSLQPSTDQLSVPGVSRGTCTLSYSGGTLQFRTNPNEVTWDYELLTHIEQTYGGRVVQILGVKMDNLTVKVDCGQGGWPYANYVAGFMRDLMVAQRNGEPATFSYTTRNWKLKVFALSVPFHDSVTETVRELELNFKIQEDIAGTQTSASLSDALQSLQDGIGWVQSIFNSYASGSGTAPNEAFGGGIDLNSTPTTTAPTAATGTPDSGIPGLSGFSSILGNLGISIP